MTVAHARHICDNRDYPSSQIRDLRDSDNCEIRDNAAMSDPQLHLKNWLAEKLKPHKRKGELAKFMGVSPNVITRILDTESHDPKKRRKIHEPEIRLIAQFLRELPPGYEQMTAWLEIEDSSEVEDKNEKLIQDVERIFDRISPQDRPAALARLYQRFAATLLDKPK